MIRKIAIHRIGDSVPITVLTPAIAERYELPCVVEINEMFPILAVIDIDENGDSFTRGMTQ
jgi:hypothetical protein